MLQLEARKLFRANGLIDDFVIYGTAGDYEEFAKAVESALSGKTLQELYLFLGTLATRKEGYSYLSEYSKSHTYSSTSPEVRLHVENT